MMYEGEDTNTIDLLYEESTIEENGVKVIVPVTYSDRSSFNKKIPEQLAYFENVYFDCQVDNKFKIFRSEHFQYSELSSTDKLHLCLDNVYYPIDFEKIGISTIEFPVALRFSLMDGLFPTPNRESIRYTKEAKALILDKIAKVADFFVNKYNEISQDTEDIEAVMNFYANKKKFVTVGDVKFDAGEISNYATAQFTEPKLKGINILDMKTIYRNREWILQEYTVNFRIENGKFKECRGNWETSIDRYQDNNSISSIYKYTDRIPVIKKEYTKSIAPMGWYKKVLFMKKASSFTLGSVRRLSNYNTYVTLLGLEKINKSLWRAAIKEFHAIIEMYTKTWIDLDALVVPQSFIDARKKVRVSVSKDRRVKLKGQIIGKEATKLLRDVSGSNCKWVSEVYNLEDLHKTKQLTVYGGSEDVKRMDLLFTTVKSDKIRFVQFSDRELKNLEKINVHNWIKLDKFMDGTHKAFRRIVTGKLIAELRTKHRSTFDKMSSLSDVSSELYHKLQTLDKYADDNYTRGESAIYIAMIEIAEQQNLFDPEIYSLYVEVKSTLERLPFINTMLGLFTAYGTPSKEFLDVMSDLFKYHKQKVNLDRYNTMAITEETVKELVEN